MKKLCIATATRAEYGVLRPLIERVSKDSFFELCLVVTGTHLSDEFGYTVREIEEDGFEIVEQIPILDDTNTPLGICKTMSKAAALFGEMYERQQPDMLLVVGDRYELLPICNSAMIYGIPIAHISGGEVTEGAIDDVVRHCVTKMSYLHFAACESYRKRIIQLGEEPSRVFNVGDIGVENIHRIQYLTQDELEDFLGISLKKPYACVTFHPVTLEKNTAIKQAKELIAALGKCLDINYIVTMANADLQGSAINQLFWQSEIDYSNIFCYSSLGIRKYLSLMRNAEFVIGNSSSGIIEAPCFGIPTINIGSRQKGRLKAQSIIDCEPIAEDIVSSIKKVLLPEFKEVAKSAKNPYGDGDTSRLIVETIKYFFKEKKIDLKKKFYDLQ